LYGSDLERSSCPTELLGGPATMAICAANIAFFDLTLDGNPIPARHETRDVVVLLYPVAVIKLQYQRVRLSAIDT
jgi:hypothetical protein